MSEPPSAPSWPAPQGPAIEWDDAAGTDATGPEGPRKRWPKVVMWGGILLMITGVLGLVGEWASRSWEMTQLLNKIQVSEAAMVDAKDAITAVTLPEDATEQRRTAARAEVQREAARAATVVDSAGDQVAGVTFLPWHSELIAAQGAYLAHNRAWVDYLIAGSQDAASLFAPNEAINSTWATAEIRVRAAVPYLAWPNVTNAVEEIFADDEEAPGPGGLTT